jgi:hypothetical protein
VKHTWLPAARKRRFIVLLLVLTVVGLATVPSLVYLGVVAESSPILPAVYEIAGGLVLGMILGWVFLWTCYRPGRMLYRVMAAANEGHEVVPFYSSDLFVSGLKELTGVTIASSASPSGAFLVFVDTGRNFELWRWHRSGPDRVARVTWSAVSGIDIATIPHFASTDRAIVLKMRVDGRDVTLPMSPQVCRSLRLRPVVDDEFEMLFARWQKRVTTSRRDAIARETDGGVRPSEAI